MSVIQFKDGSTTCVLTNGLDEYVRKAIAAASKGSVAVLERAAEALATDARSKWYDPANGGVQRDTGKSGVIRVVTTVSDASVSVAIGSADLAKAKYVHRPGRLSLVDKEVSQGDFFATPKRLRVGLIDGKYYISEINPLCSDGKFLLSELVTKPGKKKLEETVPLLTPAFDSKMKGA